MTSTSATSHTWYLPANEYYVPAAEAAAYPPRQGDLFPAGLPEISDWHACQLVHPTCELAKSSVEQLQVIRVEPLDRIKGSAAQAKVTVGFAEKDGRFEVAYANTFFLPPYEDGKPPMYSDFRDVETVDREALLDQRRVAALTHEARVTFIRREMYFRYRHFLSFESVKGLEATRISNDPAFTCPRPEWAPAAGASTSEPDAASPD